MDDELFSQARELMKAQRYEAALVISLRIIEKNPSYWNSWYVAGQCRRFLNDFKGAIEFLKRAEELKEDEPSIHMALGIAFQYEKKWNNAIQSLGRAIELDRDMDIAYNSLAYTQRLCGELDKAVYNYDAGLLAYSRRILKSLDNSTKSPILKHRTTIGHLWLHYANYAALYLVAISDREGIILPTGESAFEEERAERHRGLYWMDQPSENGDIFIAFFPNFFNTFREIFKRDFTYYNMLKNRAVVLDLIGRYDEASQHNNEADEFDPYFGWRNG